MKYEKAKVEVVLFDNSDVVTLSCGNHGHQTCTNKNHIEENGGY